jgi:hypothetical protein
MRVLMKMTCPANVGCERRAESVMILTNSTDEAQISRKVRMSFVRMEVTEAIKHTNPNPSRTVSPGRSYTKPCSKLTHQDFVAGTGPRYTCRRAPRIIKTLASIQPASIKYPGT